MKKNKPHILIIPSWYPKNADDVSGSFFREQALALEKKGYKVGVIYPQIRSARDFKGIFTKAYGLEIDNDHGLITFRWHSANFFPKLNKLHQIYWLSLGMKLFKSYIKENGIPNIIHVHSLLNGGLLAYKISQKYGVPYIVTEHSSAFIRGLIDQIQYTALTPVVSNAKHCLAVSISFADFLNHSFKTTTWQYLPNIVSNVFLSKKIQVIENPCFTFLSVCFLTKNKKIDFLLQAFAQALQENSSLFLKIGGDGPERLYLETLVDQLKIRNHVIFLGMLSRNEVLEEIQKADAFTLSSEFETFGVVLIEALALGKPVIATKCGGPESIITPDVGFLVENGSIEQFTNAMLALYENKEKYKGQTIRNYCLQQFSEDAVINKLSRIYQQVLDEHS